MTDLEALKSEDRETQKGAFASLKDAVYWICHVRLEKSFPQEIEDVVMETMIEIFEQVDQLKTSAELATHTRRIADKNAISRWRNLTAQKRGGGDRKSVV